MLLSSVCKHMCLMQHFPLVLATGSAWEYLQQALLSWMHILVGIVTVRDDNSTGFRKSTGKFSVKYSALYFFTPSHSQETKWQCEFVFPRLWAPMRDEPAGEPGSVLQHQDAGLLSSCLLQLQKCAGHPLLVSTLVYLSHHPPSIWSLIICSNHSLSVWPPITCLTTHWPPTICLTTHHLSDYPPSVWVPTVDLSA